MAGSTTGRGDGRPLVEWASDYRSLSSRSPQDLSVEELERLAVSSYLIGDDDRCASTWAEAYGRHLASGRFADAALGAFWLAFSSMMGGRTSHASAWLGRAAEALAHTDECRAHGYVLVPSLLQALDGGDPERAIDLANQASTIAQAFGDEDLAAFAALGEGQSLLSMGEVPAAMERLDGVMLAVSTGDVGPIVTGIVYCAVILECMRVYDLERAAEWTEALSGWCDAQPDLVPYRGQCLVHRSQLQQSAGDWAAALASVTAACRRLADPPHPALGLAHYQQAELRRLRGDYEEAAVEYAAAAERGHDPMPGLALLQVAQGRIDDALAGIRRALDTVPAGSRRPALLAAAVDIAGEARDLAGARRAADELRDIADRSSSSVLRAMADHAQGAASLIEGDAAHALATLRGAQAAWTALHMPLEAARTVVLIGLGCLSMGDRSSALVELQNAERAFEDLGALPDATRVRAILDPISPGRSDGGERRTELSGRELEVLSHVAAGRTNREIAAALTISQHTVGRHLENIFAKLGVNSRAAATAHAYERRLL